MNKLYTGFLMGLMVSVNAFSQDLNNIRVEHCPASKAASVSIQLFAAGDRDDASHIMDTSGLLGPGQGIDLACNMVRTRNDYCQASLLASDDRNDDSVRTKLRLNDGSTYLVCADPAKNKINITRNHCDCTF